MSRFSLSIALDKLISRLKKSKKFKFKVTDRVRVRYSDIEGHVIQRWANSFGNRYYRVQFRTPYHSEPLQQIFCEFDLEANGQRGKEYPSYIKVFLAALSAFLLFTIAIAIFV